MSDFFLHEAQAQLQLALFGMSEEFMERTNKPLRDAFAGHQDEPNHVTNFLLDLLQEMEEGAPPGHGAFHAPVGHAGSGGDAPAAAGREPREQEPAVDPPTPTVPTVAGPLSAVIERGGASDFMTKFGNALIFAFAGHDTTGHSMTWLTFELAKHPEYQTRLQEEVGALFAELSNGSLTAL
jgi:hypothetical protein